MKRSYIIKIEDLQNSLSEGSIQEISQEQVKKIKGGGNTAYACPHYPKPWPPEPDEKAPV